MLNRMRSAHTVFVQSYCTVRRDLACSGIRPELNVNYAVDYCSMNLSSVFCFRFVRCAGRDEYDGCGEVGTV